MRARQLRRAAPIALLASLTLISTPGVAFADPAAATSSQDVRTALVAKQSEQSGEKSLDQQIASAEKALEKAKNQVADAQRKLDNTTSVHDKAKQATAKAQDRLAQARKQLDKAESDQRKAEQRVQKHESAGFSFDGMVDSVLAFLGSDVTDSLGEEVENKREAVSQAEDAVGAAERDGTKAKQAKSNAEQAHEQATGRQDEAQSELDKLNERKQAEEAKKQEQAEAEAAPADGGGAAPAAAPGIVKPAEGTFTSGYGARWGTTHYGVDIANSIGTPIKSAMSGTVISSGPASGFGLWVRVQHDNGLITVYGHIDQSLVAVGQRVEAGQQIATMGNRGQSTGPHLHFEIHENGAKIDPLPWLQAHGITL
ncbi:metalloendopeptidase [Saccharomonospora piscinae]|uniref:M23 family metallopeptidase n=1 Tax=Saccharomonospora piscinae TaxID=687388 RepID=UPI0011060211|nr:M23 family metallopeptidase [Saccharomonospora piscinae]TLW91649.1 metalloendopeptidase [Saccharomonospora piscinae]